MTTHASHSDLRARARLCVRWLGALLGAVLLIGAPAVARADAADPGVTFAAHRTHGGLVVDRWTGAPRGELRPATWFRWLGDPSYVLRANGASVAAVWLGQPGEATVRSGSTLDTPVTGRVEPSWDDEAIRLTLRPAMGPPIRSDVFTRLDLGAGPAALSRATTEWSELRGTYQAALRTPDGRQVGWLRARVGLHQSDFVEYEGALPAAIDQALAAGAGAALDEEIDWIGEHTSDVPKRWL